jgi:hypothetical protein
LLLHKGKLGLLLLLLRLLTLKLSLLLITVHAAVLLGLHLLRIHLIKEIRIVVSLILHNILLLLLAYKLKLSSIMYLPPVVGPIPDTKTPGINLG